MAHFVDSATARPRLRSHETQHLPPRLTGYPTQLFCRRLIESGFHDALQTRSGRPTSIALDAYEWLSAQTDWTRYGIAAPPPELRREHYCSFEWAVSWLGEDPEKVRRQGLTPSHRVGSSQGRETWTGERVRGLPDIKRRWEIKAARLSR
jgi:hypothetical protein